MRFPILLKDGTPSECSERLHYLVASNGVFQVRRTEGYDAVIRVTGPVPGLEPEYERLRLQIPRLPRALLREVLAFFRCVYEEHGGEAIVVLFYRPDTREYRVEVPEQTIPGYRSWDGRWRARLHLSYGDVERSDGYLRYGTIHSHADTAAYASATDCADEREGGDGLHAVYGHVHRAEPSVCAHFVVNEARFRLEPDDVLEPCRVPREPARRDWMERVRREESSWITSSIDVSCWSVSPDEIAPLERDD